MKLCISKEYTSSSLKDDTVVLSTSMMQFTSTHMFIAANHWESTTIELDESIPENTLLHISLVSDAIFVKLPEKVTDKILHLLIELYPEKAGRLRHAFMTGQSMIGVLDGCLV